jgi:hypothetical protein
LAASRRVKSHLCHIPSVNTLVDTCDALAGLNLNLGCGGVAQGIGDRGAPEVEVERRLAGKYAARFHEVNGRELGEPLF